MSEREIEKGEAELKNKKLKKEKSIDEAKIELSDKLNERLEDPKNQDSTDGITDFIKEMFQTIFDEFKAQIGEK